MTVNLQTVTAKTGAGLTLTVLDGTVSLDDSWYPLIQVSLTIVPPADPSVLDPRTLPTVNLTLTQQFGPSFQFTRDLTAIWGGILTSALTVLWATKLTSQITASFTNRIYSPNASFRSATAVELTGLNIRDHRNDDDGNMVLQLSSSERLLDDLASLTTRTIIPTGDFNIRTLFAILRARGITAGAADVVSLAPGLVNFSVPGSPSPTINAGQSYYNFLLPFMQIGNVRIATDVDGVMRVVDNKTLAAGSLALTGDTIESFSDVIDRADDWGNAVVINYLASDDGFYYPSVYAPAGFSRVVTIDVDSKTPFDSYTAATVRQAPARAAYDRIAARGRELELTALNDFSARPSMAATITNVPQLDDLDGVVDKVEWSLSTGLMTISVRDIGAL